MATGHPGAIIIKDKDLTHSDEAANIPSRYAPETGGILLYQSVPKSMGAGMRPQFINIGKRRLSAVSQLKSRGVILHLSRYKENLTI